MRHELPVLLYGQAWAYGPPPDFAGNMVRTQAIGTINDVLQLIVRRKGHER